MGNARSKGGQGNRSDPEGLRSTVCSGGSNEARAEESVVVGAGHAFNQAQGNICDGIRSVVVGGSANQTTGGAHTPVVGSGLGRSTTTSYDWTAGTLYESE